MLKKKKKTEEVVPKTQAPSNQLSSDIQHHVDELIKVGAVLSPKKDQISLVHECYREPIKEIISEEGGLEEMYNKKYFVNILQFGIGSRVADLTPERFDKIMGWAFRLNNHRLSVESESKD